MPTTQARPEEAPKPIRKAAKKAANGADRTAAPADFWETLRGLKPGQFFVYAYRLWPKIDRRDESHYLTKTSEHIDEDWLLRTFGSGKYSLRLNDSEQRSIATKTVSLHNANFPPKVNPLEITSDPENDVYWRVWGKEQQAQEANPTAAPSASGSDAGAAIAALEKIAARMADDSSAVRATERELMHSAASSAIEMVRSQGAQGVDVGRILETVAGLFERFETRQPASHGGDMAPVLSLMQAQIESQNKLVLELLRQREPAPAAGGSKVGELGELLAVMRELRQEFSDTPRDEPERPWWAHIMPAVGPALQLLAANQSGAAAGLPGISGAPPQPTAPPPQGRQDAPQSPQPDQSQQHAQQGQEQPQQAQLAAFIGQLAYPIFSYLTAEEPDGAELADWMLAGYPPEVLVQAQQLGPDLLKAVIMGHAELWPQLAAAGVDEARLTRFIGEFCAWSGDDEPAQPEGK